MVLRYKQNYTISSCIDVARIGADIPHFVDRNMRPYGVVNNYISTHHKRWSKNTVRTVSDNLLDFLRWMENAGVTLKNVKMRHVELYMNANAEASPDKPLSMSTVVQRVGHVCRLLDWAKRKSNFFVLWDGDEDAERGMTSAFRRGFHRNANSEISPQLIRQSTRFLVLPDAIKFIDTFKLDGDLENIALSIRNQLMAKIMLQCGLRVDEVVKLPVDWVREIIVNPRRNVHLGRVKGKGNKVRPIEWPTKLLLEVQEYIDFQRQTIIERTQSTDKSYRVATSLFLGSDGRPITTNWVGKLFKRTAQASGIMCTPHMLRHTYGTYHYLFNKDLAKLANLMGHSNEETTRTYYVHTAALVFMSGNFRDFQDLIDAQLGVTVS